MIRAAATSLVVTVAVVAFTLVSGAPGGASPANGSVTSGSGKTGTHLRLATAGERRKALARCRKIRAEKKRKACIKRVKRRFGSTGPKPPVTPDGPVEEVQVLDKYFMPDRLELPRFGSVRWVWGSDNSEPHGITLQSGPKGVSSYDFKTPLAPSLDYTFERKFKVPGRYLLVCTMHFSMTMTVDVGG